MRAIRAIKPCQAQATQVIAHLAGGIRLLEGVPKGWRRSRALQRGSIIFPHHGHVVEPILPTILQMTFDPNFVEMCHCQHAQIYRQDVLLESFGAQAFRMSLEQTSRIVSIKVGVTRRWAGRIPPAGACDVRFCLCAPQ